MGQRIVLGLSGYASSGKDTVGAYLVEYHGFHRIAFGDVMKQCLYALNPLVVIEARFGGDYEYRRLQDLVDELGWDEAKQIPEVRALLQRFGTQAGRDILGQDVWVIAAMGAAANHDRVVFTDCRFLNEARAVQATGGHVVRIARAGVGPANDHISETGLDDFGFDRYVINDRDLSTLKFVIHELVRDFLRGTSEEIADPLGWWPFGQDTDTVVA